MSQTLGESILTGPIPRAEVPGWREKYGVVAGITRKPYDLGLWTKEPTDAVMTRWREFRRLEPGFNQYVMGHQVHGTRVELHTGPHGSRGRRNADRPGGRRVSDGPEGGGEWQIFDGVDGHVTGSSGTMLNVTVADCTPIYLLHPPTRTVALLHAGWRGTARGILQRGLQSLLVAAQGIPDEEAVASVVCHLGVSICRDCYQVGPEVFEAMGLPRPAGEDGKGLLDVRAVLGDQAMELGIGAVTESGHCSRHGDGWFSHRGGDAGRMVAYLGVQG